MTKKEWKPILHLNKNEKGRDFVCGDIHGCFDEMEAELKKIGFDKHLDRLFCTGDIIDRGPLSEKATFYMKQDWFFTVMGNHEYMFLNAILDTPESDEYLFIHIKNGGGWAYEMEQRKVDAMINAIEELPLIIKIDEVIIVHAALPPVKNIEDIENKFDKYLDIILWHRDEYPSVKLLGIKKVYVGHNMVTKPVKDGKYMNIDTGVVRKYLKKQGKLTILEI